MAPRVVFLSVMLLRPTHGVCVCVHSFAHPRKTVVCELLDRKSGLQSCFPIWPPLCHPTLSHTRESNSDLARGVRWGPPGRVHCWRSLLDGSVGKHSQLARVRMSFCMAEFDRATHQHIGTMWTRRECPLHAWRTYTGVASKLPVIPVIKRSCTF
jgi:hypothetical protein